MAINIGTLLAHLELQNNLSTALQVAVSDMERAGARMKSVGEAITVSLSAPIAAVGGVAVKSFSDFETAMKGVEAALVPTKAELQQLEAAAIEWGAKTKFSATESAEALGELGKAGFTVTQSIDALPSVLQLSTVAGMGLAAAATLTADTLTQFNLHVDQAGRVNDVLAKGAQASTVDVQQLGESLKYAGPVAGAFGMSIEATVGALAAFGNAGIKGEMAGTALRNVLTDIAVPTKGMKEGMEALGISTLKSADGTIKLAEVIDTLQKRGADAATIMTMFGDRAGPGMVALVAKGTNEVERLQAEMQKAGGTAQQVSDVMMSGMGGALEQMRGSVETAGIALGRVLAPAVRDAAIAIGGLADFATTTLIPAFQLLPQPVQTTVVALVALVAAAGPAIFVFGKLSEAAAVLAGTRAIGLLTGAIWTLGNTVPVLTARVWLLDTAQKAAALSAGAWSAASSTAFGTALGGAATRVGAFAAALASVPVALTAAAAAAATWISSLSTATNMVVERIGGPLGQLIAAFTQQRAVMNSLGPAIQKHTQDLQLAGEATSKGATQSAGHAAALNTLAVQLREAQKGYASLTDVQRAEIDAGLKLHKTTDDIVEAVNKLGKGTKITAGVVELYEQAQRSATKATKDHNAELKKNDEFQKVVQMSVWRTTEIFQEAYEKQLQAAKQGMERSGAEIIRMVEAKRQAEERAADISRQLTMGELAYKLDAINREGEARKKAFDGTSELARQARAAIDTEVGASLAATVIRTKEVQTVFAGLAASIPGLFGPLSLLLDDAAGNFDAVQKKTTTWREGLSNIAQAFTNLAQSTHGAMSGIAEALGSAINAADLGVKAGGQFFKGFKAAMDPAGEGGKNWGDISANIAAGLLGGIGSIAAATDPSKSLVSRLIGGAATGAALGGAIATAASYAGLASKTGQIYIVAAAAIVGAFVGYFRGLETRRLMEKVGQEWGTEISKGLAEKIKNQKSMFQGQDIAASLFNMDAIIKEAGGLNAVNFDQFLGKLRDVFVMVERGLFDVTQARHVLDENFSAFADQIVKSGRVASQQFQEILALNAQMGVYATGVLDFVSQRTAVAAEGINALAGPLLASIETFKQGMDAGTVSAEQQIQFTAKSAAEIDNLGVIAVGAFAAARKAGLSYYDALKQAGPGIDSLIKAQQELGLTSDNVALQELVHFRDRVNANQTLVAATEALNSTMLAMSQIGGLNAETLRALEQQGLTTYDRLRAANFTENEALSMMRDFLLNVIEAHEQLGTPIDENTAALIDQADSMGLLKRDGSSMLDVLKGGFETLTKGINRLIETLGGVPLEFDKIGKAIDDIPKTIPIQFEYPEVHLPKPPVSDELLPQYRFGTGGLRYFGDGTTVQLHDWEAVVPRDEYLAMTATTRGMRDVDSGAWTSRLDDLASGGSTVVNIDARGALLGDYASQLTFKRMVEDALVGRVGDQRQIGLGRAA
jgi:TP901 family phage tail tape measure protein